MTDATELLKQPLTNTERILSELPPYLKDRANYPKIRKALYESFASKHSHSDLQEWSLCVKCQTQVQKHAVFMKKLGFKTKTHYLTWRKIHETIDKRVPLR